MVAILEAYLKNDLLCRGGVERTHNLLVEFPGVGVQIVLR